VVHPDDDVGTAAIRCIQEVSGANGLLDTLVVKLKPQRRPSCSAGFYQRARLVRVSAGVPARSHAHRGGAVGSGDLVAVAELANSGTLDLDGLITHREPAARAAAPTSRRSPIPTASR
jgi:bacteriochlorophyllide a dehydrogenase